MSAAGHQDARSPCRAPSAVVDGQPTLGRPGRREAIGTEKVARAARRRPAEPAERRADAPRGSSSRLERCIAGGSSGHGRQDDAADVEARRPRAASSVSSVWLIVPRPGRATTTSGRSSSTSEVAHEQAARPVRAGTSSPPTPSRQRVRPSPRARAASIKLGRVDRAPASSAARCGETAGPKRSGATAAGVDARAPPRAARGRRGLPGSGSSRPVTTGLNAATRTPRAAQRGGQRRGDDGLADVGVGAGDEAAPRTPASRRPAVEAARASWRPAAAAGDALVGMAGGLRGGDRHAGAGPEAGLQRGAAEHRARRRAARRACARPSPPGAAARCRRAPSAGGSPGRTRRASSAARRSRIASVGVADDQRDDLRRRARDVEALARQLVAQRVGVGLQALDPRGLLAAAARAPPARRRPRAAAARSRRSASARC